MKFKVGDRVRWNDPAIDDYDPADRKYIRSRVFEIEEIYGEEDDDDDPMVLLSEVEEISGGCSEAEAWMHELRRVKL